MAHTFTNLLTHVVFSTKGREPFLKGEFRSRLWAYLSGIVRHLQAVPMEINGPPDHVHLLVSLPPGLSVAELMRVVKSNSSRWVHEQWPSRKAFAWQEGYGAFSVSQSNKARVLQYIQDQEEHHRKVSFQEEFLAFLKKHAIAYDECFLWK